MMPAAVSCPSVSVIVPVHNAGTEFQRCLESLTRAAPAPGEIIIVADGPSSGSGRIAPHPGFRLLTLPVAGGPACARNRGAGAAEGDILLFIDSDVAVPSDIVSKITAIFTGRPELAAAIGSYDDEPAAGNFLSQYKNLLHHYVHQQASENGFTFWGACGAVRREIFAAVGGFDESYRAPSVEDIELGYRLKQAGYQIQLVKDLQVKHLKRWGVASLLKTDFFHRALPWTTLVLRHRRFPNDLNLRRSSRLSGALACGLAFSIVAAIWIRGGLLAAGALACLLALLNARLYLFFYRKRGLRFALSAIPWHWLYFLYSTVAFTAGAAGFITRRWASRSFGDGKSVSSMEGS